MQRNIASASAVTLEEFLPSLKAYLSTMEAKMVELVSSVAREAAGQSLEEKQRYMMLMQHRSQESFEAAALAAAGGKSQELFNGCLMKFQGEPAVRKVFEGFQQRQGDLLRILSG